MKIILFDLGETLEHENKPLPKSKDTLRLIKSLKDFEGLPPLVGLISDFHMASNQEELNLHLKEYQELLETLDLRSFFEPFEQMVTLSTEVGVHKPDEKIFKFAIEKMKKGTPFNDVMFITENFNHVKSARILGINAIHFKGPGQEFGEVHNLIDLVPIIRNFIQNCSCNKLHKLAVGRYTSNVNKSKKKDSRIEELIQKVDRNNLHENLLKLTEFKTRWSYSPTIHMVTEWLHGQFVNMGYKIDEEVRYQLFDMPQAQQPHKNVLCGTNNTDEGFILVCGHYDSVSENSETIAPGADDNASGVAALLELARILKGKQSNRRILFAVFGGEEQNLIGSNACAAMAEQENWKIDVVINLDMISYRNPGSSPKIIVEYDQGNKTPDNDSAAKAYGLLMAQAAKDYTLLDVEHTDIWNSDYIPFENKGYACIGAYNPHDNPFYHKSTDTIGNVNLDQLYEVVKMVLATIVILSES
jgi:FMN phosphatase YigB (HAD superfamily)